MNVFLRGLLVLLVLSVTSMNAAYGAESAENMLTTIKNHKKLSKFYDLIVDSDLDNIFEKEDLLITVFAPTNDALNKLPSEVQKRIKGKAYLQGYIKYHIITDNKVFSSNIKGRKISPSTSSGETLLLDGTGESIKINNAKFVTPDISASNGLLHIVDTVIIPPSFRETVEKTNDKTIPEKLGMPKVEESKTEIKPEVKPDKQPDLAIPAELPPPPTALAKQPEKPSGRKWKFFGW